MRDVLHSKNRPRAGEDEEAERHLAEAYNASPSTWSVSPCKYAIFCPDAAVQLCYSLNTI